MADTSLSVFLSAGPVSSILVNRYGCRTIVMVGGLMSGLSVAAASLTNSIIYLYFLIGIVGGKGCDCLAANTVTNFEQDRSFWVVLFPDRCVFSEDVEHLPQLLNQEGQNPGGN